MWTSTRTAATAFDNADALLGLRAQYSLPPGMLRLDGKSGGALPSTTPARLRRFFEPNPGNRAEKAPLDADWRREARMAAAELAGLLKANPAEITVAESTSMNLFKTLLAATRLRPDRRVLAVGYDCFATDRYLARSAADFAGCELRLLEGPKDLEAAFDDGVAVVALSHTDLLSGELRDPAAVTAETHRHGALALWDLSDSAGALRVDLHGWDADFAIGCGHKFLGGGSGAPAYCFIAERHHADLADRCAKEFGSGVADPLGGGFDGTPSAMSMAELRAGLSILDGVSAEALENKATGLVTIFLQRLLEQGSPEGVEVLSPAGGAPRGSHVCLRHPRAQYLAHGLFSRGVVVDYIEPDLLRFSFAPSWLRYLDAWEAAESLHEVLEELSFSR